MVGHSFSGPASAFPSRESWKDFNTLFNLNKPSMFASGDSGEDVGRIFNAINSAAKAIGVEERVILAIIIRKPPPSFPIPCSSNFPNLGPHRDPSDPLTLPPMMLHYSPTQ